MMSRISPILCVLLGLAFGVPAAWAQDGTASPVDDARVAAVHDRLTASVQAARAAGLPAGWIEEKVAEGLAKHVPPPIIAAAVDGLLARMRTADAILGDAILGPTHMRADRAHRQAVLRATVDALSAGGDPRSLAHIAVLAARARHDPLRSWQDVREAMITVAELGERGFETAYATAVTARALTRAGVPGLAALLDAARTVHGRDPAQRRHALDRALDDSLGHGPPPGHGAGRPDDHGGPAHDDSLNQGQHRGRPTRGP